MRRDRKKILLCAVAAAGWRLFDSSP
jgi:hypothetical protein